MTAVVEVTEWMRLATNAAQLALILALAWGFRPSFSNDPRAPLRAIGWRMVSTIVDHGAGVAGRRLGEEIVGPLAAVERRVASLRVGQVRLEALVLRAISLIQGGHVLPEPEPPFDDDVEWPPARGRTTKIPPSPSRRNDPDDTPD